MNGPISVPAGSGSRSAHRPRASDLSRRARRHRPAARPGIAVHRHALRPRAGPADHRILLPIGGKRTGIPSSTSPGPPASRPTRPCAFSPARTTTGSRPARWPLSAPRPTRSRSTSTGSARGSAARPGKAIGARCPRKAWSTEHCRCHPTGNQSCFWPTTGHRRLSGHRRGHRPGHRHAAQLRPARPCASAKSVDGHSRPRVAMRSDGRENASRARSAAASPTERHPGRCAGVRPRRAVVPRAGPRVLGEPALVAPVGVTDANRYRAATPPGYSTRLAITRRDGHRPVVGDPGRDAEVRCGGSATELRRRQTFHGWTLHAMTGVGDIYTAGDEDIRMTLGRNSLMDTTCELLARGSQHRRPR